MRVVGNNVCSYFFFVYHTQTPIPTFNHRCRAEKKSRVFRAHAHLYTLYIYIFILYIIIFSGVVAMYEQ